VRRSFIRNHVLLLSSCALALCIVVAWILYSLCGHSLIEILYKSEPIGIMKKVMEGRSVTPLQRYYQEADKLMVVGTSWVVAGFLILAILIRKPLGAVLVCCSLLFSFSLLFFSLELFPALVDLFHLNSIDYYAYRKNYIADDKLVYREKTLVSTKLSNFRGAAYSPVYNIPVIPTTIDWTTDEQGFRNSHTTKSADLVVLGDSFMEYGDNEADTFGKRLEKKLPGLVVANLGKSGYGPFQYLEVLKKYGIDKKPKDVLFGFYEGNDLKDIKAYLEWKKGYRKGEYGGIRTALTGNLLQRYTMALRGTIRFIGRQTLLLIDIAVSKIWHRRGYIHPRVIVVNLRNKIYRMLFVPELSEKPTEELWKSAEVKMLRMVLRDFKILCEKHNIDPTILYIPSVSNIYAEYSTMESGSSWLGRRQGQILAKKNLEHTVVNLAEELGLELINLSPVYEAAANEGKMLYYALDSHWNAEGREEAAAFVAQILNDKFIPTSGKN
jgi:hypothetical protein